MCGGGDESVDVTAIQLSVGETRSGGLVPDSITQEKKGAQQAVTKFQLTNSLREPMAMS